MNIKRIYNFFAHDIWRTTGMEMGRGKRLGVSTIKTLILTIRGFNDNDISMRSNSLTYSFMFALVPIIAMLVAVARGFGFEQVIEEHLSHSFLSSYDIVPTIMGFVQRYLETAQGGAFIGVGIFILLWAIYSFFRNVETSFNKIWQVEKSRSIVSQVTSYISILIAVPILLIASSGVSIYVNSTISELNMIKSLSVMNTLLLKLIPWITSWFVFFLIYWTIPNTRVKWYSALIPGILIGTIVQVLQMASVYIIMFLGRTSVVYGTFAAIPLLLTWVQWTCIAILFGAELSYSIQNNEHFDFLQESESMSRRYKDYLTLYICYIIIRRFEQGEEAYTAQEIAKINHLPVRVINNLISRLTTTHILSEIRPAIETEEVRYQPALDINKITVGMVIEHIEKQGIEGFFKHLSPEMTQFWQHWTNLRREDAQFNSLLVKDIMKQSAQD